MSQASSVKPVIEHEQSPASDSAVSSTVTESTASPETANPVVANQVKVTLDQWQVFVAVIDHGGFAQAAESLDRSQSAISYGMAKLQQQLGVDVVKLQGRKAVLTPNGEVLLRHARRLLHDANRIERLGHALESGWEAQVRLTVDTAFPSSVLHHVLRSFADELPDVQLQLSNAVMSGVEDALVNQQTDLAICPWVPAGFLGSRLFEFNLIAVSAPEHPLQHLGRTVTADDLVHERQVVVRDSGTNKRNIGWLGATTRWTVGSMSDSVAMLREGLGYAWLPEHYVAQDLAAGTLKPLPLNEGVVRPGELYLIWLDRDLAGPACKRLADMLTEASGAA